MAFTPGKSGNPGGKPKEKLYHQALMMELKAAGDDLPELRAIARRQIETAIHAENPNDALAAAKEIANRLDGQPVAQQDVNINERITVIEAPAPKANTEEWLKSLKIDTMSSGVHNQARKLNS